jgi:hypothetical protein
MKDCVICNTSFIPRSSRAICCSVQCSAERERIKIRLRAKEYKENGPFILNNRNCAHCKAEFKPINRYNICCSVDCGYMRNMERTKARMKTTTYWQETRNCKICQKEFVVRWKLATKRLCSIQCKRKSQSISNIASFAKKLSSMSAEEKEKERQKKLQYQHKYRVKRRGYEE